MRIQFLGGGLANQIRQYVFLRYVERRCEDIECLFDDSYFFAAHVVHNGYELGKVFGTKVNLLSNYLDVDAWKHTLKQIDHGVWLPQILLNMGVPAIVVKEQSFREYFSGILIENCGYHPEILSLPYNNVYYAGYWVEDDWFEQDREENLRELVFPELRDMRNLRYAEEIQKSMSVGVHVRRGDFVKLGWAAPSADFKKSCKHILDVYPDARFFVFSDDLYWCQKNAEELGFNLAAHTVYVAGNSGEKSYIDMQLLSMCRGIIRPAQSSFSQVAAWLDQNLEIELKVGETFYE